MTGSTPSDDSRCNVTWRAMVAAFVEGVAQPSLLGCVGVLLLVVVQFAVLCHVVTPRFIARCDPGYLQNDAWDDFTYMTFQLQRLKQTKPARLATLFTGSSTIREAIRDDRIMQSELTCLMGFPVDFYITGTSWQSLWETAAILDHLPEGFRGLVVIGVAPGRLSRSKAWLERLLEHPHLALDSPSFREEVRLAGIEPPRRTGIYLIDHAKFFAARRQWPWRMILGPVEYQRHRYENAPSWTEGHWSEARQEVDGWLDGFEQHGTENFAVLERIIARLREKKIRAVLLETPIHRRTISHCRPRYRVYCQAMADFARRHDVPYWSLDEEAGLTESDFHDWVHVKDPAAQRRYQTALARRIQPILQQIDKETP